MFSEQDHFWMQQALVLAKTAAEKGEVPVGAIVVLDEKIIGEGYNCPIQKNDPTAHAELVALRNAAQFIGNYRLVNASIYVTLEPCMMCAGAMVHSRIKHLIHGALDLKAGAIQSRAQIFNQNFLNHQVKWKGGLLKKECGKILQDFFQAKRSSL